MTLVIFDIDGTLTDTTGIDDFCFFKTFFDLFRINLIGANWSNYVNVTDPGITYEVFQEKMERLPTDEEIRKVKEYFINLLKLSWELTPERFSEIPGAKEIIWKLQERGHKIAFATGAWHDSAIIKLKSIDIDPTEFPFGNADYSHSREEIIKHVVTISQKFYSSDFGKITYIGDGKWDYETCKKLKVDFIGIDSKNNGQLKKLGAETVFRNFKNSSEIIKFLE
jgi:phosphoglycolate phosphatase-like HAD superfamily hydrolase